MLDMLIKGGPVMVPIVLCSVLALAVILERLWFFSRTRSDGERLLSSVRGPLEEGKYLEAMQKARQHADPVAALFAAGIAYADKNTDEIRLHLQQVAREEIYRMERGLSLLGAVVSIAPLLGLLGTVTGIIKSFNVLSALQGLEGPYALSIGIAEALLTTAFGLIVAIPALACYEWFTSMVDRRVQEMNHWGGKLVDLLVDTRGEA